MYVRQDRATASRSAASDDPVVSQQALRDQSAAWAGAILLDSAAFVETYHFPCEGGIPAQNISIHVPTRAAALRKLQAVLEVAGKQGIPFNEVQIEMEHIQIWGAAITLAASLRLLPLDNLRVCEVGCGLGLGGLVAATAGAQSVLLTDLPEVIEDTKPFQRQTAIAHNVESRVTVSALDWGSSDLDGANSGNFDLVIGSDILYAPKHAVLLSSLLNRGSFLAEDGLFVIVDSDRPYQADTIKALRDQGFSVRTQRRHTTAVVDAESGQGQRSSRIDTIIVGSRGSISSRLVPFDEALCGLALSPEEGMTVHRKSIEVKPSVTGKDVAELCEKWHRQFE